jgi:hypothetical protein
MMTLTQFLENIMISTLLGLPREIKELIYFDALSHAANKILVRNHSSVSSLSVLALTHISPHRPSLSLPT